jgi:hypothetical protein
MTALYHRCADTSHKTNPGNSPVNTAPDGSPESLSYPQDSRQFVFIAVFPSPLPKTSTNQAQNAYQPELSDPRDLAIKRRFQLLEEQRRLLAGSDDWRKKNMCLCQRAIAPGVEYPAGQYSPKLERARYRGLVLCNKDPCVFCSLIRSEQARRELTVLLLQAAKDPDGLYPMLLTLTIRHRRGDSLATLSAALQAAYDKMFVSGKAAVQLREKYLIEDKIKSFEETYGANGWHPHLHITLLTRLELVGHAVEHARLALARRWQEVLKSLGYSADLEHGLSLETANSKIVEYVTKYGHEPVVSGWDVEHEMTKGALKKARKDGLTPFELLAASAGLGGRDGELDPADRLAALLGVDREAARKRAGALYKEFVDAVKGRHRLVIAPKTRKALDLATALEQYNKDNPPPESDYFDMVLLDHKGWQKVKGYHQQPDGKIIFTSDKRAALLSVVRTGDPRQVVRWLYANQIKGWIPDNAWIASKTLSEADLSDFSPIRQEHDDSL